MHCEVCGIEVVSKRSGVRYCSARCRKEGSRRASVTDNVTLSDPDVTLIFRFTIRQRSGAKKGDKDWDKNKSRVREEKYWYEVPLAAVPIIQKGWPQMPDWMNGRQYFLWWKNEFKTGEDGRPIILNPFPKYDKLTYVQAGEGSRRWGA